MPHTGSRGSFHPRDVLRIGMIVMSYVELCPHKSGCDLRVSRLDCPPFLYAVFSMRNTHARARHRSGHGLRESRLDYALFLQALSVNKFLRALHLSSNQTSSDRSFLLPDILTECEDIAFQLCDDPFEVKLRANHEVISLYYWFMYVPYCPAVTPPPLLRPTSRKKGGGV